jgi:hypothetical protein
VQVKCETCEEGFVAKASEVNRGYGRFCSRPCSSSRVRPTRRNRVELACAECGSDFERKVSSLSGSKHGIYFCTRGCKDRAQRLGGVTKIQPPHYGTGTDYRSLAFRKYPPVCNRCRLDDRRILVVHHKDRDRSNNAEDNLEILCPNCHAVDHLNLGD